MKLNGIKDEIKQQNKLFKEEKEEVMQFNLLTLSNVTMFALFLFLLIALVTPVIFPGWKMSAPYYSMFIFLLVFYVLAILGRKKEVYHYNQVQIMCLLFYVFTIMGLICIDIMPYPDSEVTFFPIVVVVFPVLFILPYYVYLFLNLSLEIFFIFLDISWKIPQIWRKDIFNSLVGMFFSFAVAWVVLCARTKEKAEKKDLKKLSTIDYLTGILNKFSCEKSIIESLEHRKKETICALFVIDIDDFKQVNDNYGHHIGDIALLRFGETLKETFRINDIIGRIGGDEFIVYIRQIQSKDMIKKKCEQLQKKVSALSINESLKISCSIGVAVMGREEVTFEELFQLADDALYETKKENKGNYTIQISKLLLNTLKKKVMLIVDDDEMNREIIRLTFAEEFKFLEANDGTEFLTLLKENRMDISIVMLDLVMPKMNGYEVLTYLKNRQIYKNLPVIVITGDQKSEEKALSLGAVDMVLKPIDPAVLKMRVNNAIKRNI